MKDKLEKLRPLVEQFRSHIKQYKSAGYDEANVRVDFIDKYFEILDWDVRNTQGFSEDYREVVREDRVIIAGKPKAPDYSFRVGGRRKFFVEAKKPLIYIKEELEPAYQVRRYGYTAKLPLSVLTDFEEFAVYDTRIKPSKNDKASVGRLYYCTFEDYQKNFEFLYETFSKTAVLKGSFDRYVKENKVKKGTSEVDREFLELISEWREKLAKNIAANNARADITLVNTAVQKIIDRIIFLRIAEDRGTEPYGKLKECGEAKKVYGALGELFEKARAKYNGDLFKPDDAVNKLHIENDALTGMFNEMYFPDCPYEFSVFPIEVLGNIYEQFLGKTIRLTEGHRAKIEEKPEVRKAGGVYYTPQYIVNYIVENTVGAVIGAAFDSPSTPLGDRSRGTAQPMVSRNETGDRVRDPMTPAQISKLKILDPACGSGSFLIGAYGYLLDYHLKYYMAPENRAKAVKEEKIYQIDEHHFHLTIKEKQNILLNNIYGVDIDPQAVEVTKLSLLLKLMENETKESEGKLFKHSDEKYLPNLSNNIKCGNSLIGSDFYDDKDMGLFGKEEIRKVNTFDWSGEAGFADIIKAGGFDVVIGNPPYVDIKGLPNDYINYIYKAFQHSNNRINLFASFIEKSLSLVNKNFKYSMIVPTALLSQDSYKQLRRWISEYTSIISLVRLPNESFGSVAGDVKVDTVIFVFSNICKLSKTKVISYEGYDRIDTINENNAFVNTTIDQNIWMKSDDCIWSVNTKPIDISILSKCKNDSIKLEDCVSFSLGLTPYDKYKGHTEKQIHNKVFHSNYKKDDTYKKLLAGNDVERYFIKWNGEQYISYGPWLGASREQKYFTSKRILVKQIIDWSSKRIWASLTVEELYNTQNAFNLIEISRYKLEYVLGIINSKLITFYHKKTFLDEFKMRFQKILIKDCKQFPIKSIDFNDKFQLDKHDQLVSLVTQMLDTQKLLHNSKTDHDRETYQKKADLIDGQIDRLVYELYGLTEEEIKIVEGEG